MVSFFTSEVTPYQINIAAGAIVEAVVQSQKQHKSSARVQMGLVSSSEKWPLVITGFSFNANATGRNGGDVIVKTGERF